MISVRRFGSTKSIVVVTGLARHLGQQPYGALFALGWCGLIRIRSESARNLFGFS